jgi:hypothetical protein
MNFKSVFSFKKSNQSLPFLPQSKAGVGLDKSKQKLVWGVLSARR